MRRPFSWSDGRQPVVLLLLQLVTAWCCPPKCLCEYGRVSCKGVGLQQVPYNLPPHTIELVLSHNSLTDIPRLYFKNLTNMSILDVSYNEISSPFSLPESVSTLYLNNNRLTGEVLANILIGAKNLVILELSNNILGAPLPHGTFADLGRLRMLKMGSCSLSELKPRTFAIMGRLMSLDMRGNQLSNLAPGTFEGLVSLVFLILSGNPLSTLQSGVFDGLSSNLSELLLYACNVSYIGTGVFSNMSGLQRFDLRENRLKQVPDFRGLPKEVRVLDIGNNLISNITDLANVGLLWFSTLELPGNRIEFLPSRMFQTLRVSELLNLSHNKIQELPDDCFANCTGLLKLLLNHNNIKVISSRAFTGLKSLRQLTLFHNKISSISKLVFYETPLKDLLIHSNNISLLDQDTFRGLNKTLERLTLFGNPITELPFELFEDMGHNTIIALTCANLKRLPVGRKPTMQIQCAPAPSFFLVVHNNEMDKLQGELLKSGFSCRMKKGAFSYKGNCTFCPPGYRGDVTGLDTNCPCIPCPPGGFFQDEQGQVFCKRCKKGTYVSPEKHPGASPSDCMACPQGTKSDEMAGYRACRCLPNFYRFDRFGACSLCRRGGVICQNDTATLASGYYWKWVNESQRRQYKRFCENINTVGSEYNRTYSKFSGKLPASHTCPMKDACLGGIDSNCSEGYQGPLCAICRPRYFLHLNTCAKCPSMVRAVLQAIGVIVAFVFVLLAVLWGDSKKADHNRTWADVILSRFKIVVSFYQVMVAVFSALSRVPWPAAVITVARWLKYAEANVLEFSQLSCIDSRFHFNSLQQFFLVVCGNVAVVVLSLTYMAFKICHIQRKDVQSSQKLHKISAVKRLCYRNIFVFLFTTYPSTCVKITQILPPACVKLCFSEGEQYCQSFLRSDFSVQCFTPEHNRYWPAAAILALYPVGFPIIVLLLLWKYYYRLLKEEEQLRQRDEPSLEGNDHVMQQLNVHAWKQPNVPDATFLLSLFYENYKPRYWFWEVTEMYRKLLLMCGLVFIGSHSRSQVAIGVLLSGIFSMLHAAYKPITDKSENMLQSVALLVIFFDLSLGVMLTSSGEDVTSYMNKENDSVGVSVLFVAVNCLVIAMAIVKAIKTIVKLCRRRGGHPEAPLPMS